MSRKYVMFEAARTVATGVDEEGRTTYKVIETYEIFELNDQIINVYTADEKIVNGTSTICCNIKFIERRRDGSNCTLTLHVFCTTEQAVRNIRVAQTVLEKFIESENKCSVKPSIIKDEIVLQS